MDTPVDASNTRSRGTVSCGANPVVAILSVVTLIALWGASFYLSSADSVSVLFNLPAVVVVAFSPVLILFAIYGWAAPIDALYYVFGKRSDRDIAREAAQLFQTWAALALACGCIATVVGLVLMLSSLDDPAKIGPWTAVALLSQLYGVCIAVACIACSAMILRRYPNPDAAAALARQSITGAGMTVVAGTITALAVIAILTLSFSTSP